MTTSKAFKTWARRIEDATSGDVPLSHSNVIMIYNLIYGGRSRGRAHSTLTFEERSRLQAAIEAVEGGLHIDSELEQKGLYWLRKQIVRRVRSDGYTNRAFTDEDVEVVENFSHFRFVGAACVRDNGYVQQYVPIYRVCALDGRSFDYAHAAWQTSVSRVETRIFTRSWQDPYICPSCGEPFDPLDDGEWADLTERQICSGCYEMDLVDHVSTLVRYGPEGKLMVRFGDERTDTDEGLPDWALDLFPNSAFPGRQYHRTDGWRGYYCTERGMDMERFTVVTEGWVTGDYGDVSWKHDSHIFMERLAGGDYPPVNLYALFEGTSNVFSTVATYLVAKGDEAALRAWAEQGVSIERLHEALR